MHGGNLEPAYLAINPNGTVPTLTTSERTGPLIDTRLILEYINSLKSGSGIPDLVPAPESETGRRIAALIELVHSDEASTNILLLMPRDAEELEAKRKGGIGAFIGVRQEVIERNLEAGPGNKAYTDRVDDNRML